MFSELRMIASPKMCRWGDASRSAGKYAAIIMWGRHLTTSREGAGQLPREATPKKGGENGERLGKSSSIGRRSSGKPGAQPVNKKEQENMEVNPLRRVLTAKALSFVGLAMLVAVVVLMIASMTPVDQADAAPPKAKAQAAQVKSQFGAREVINDTGPLPLEGTYNKRRGGTLIISAAGSGYSSAGEQKIGMKVLVNGKEVGIAQVYTNEKLSHKAFVPAFEVVNLVPAGKQVNIELQPLDNNTKTDENDFFRVTVEEQPRG
jgi:hypothetical protein